MKTRYFIIFVTATIVLASITCIFFYDDPLGILSSILASGCFALIIEWAFLCNEMIENNKLAYLKGEYKRTEITNARDQRNDEGIYDSIMEGYMQVNPIITMSHKEGGKYSGVANYAEGEIEFIINLDKTNPLTGSGVYQYTKKDRPDIGKYTVQVDVNNSGKIYIYYENIIPSGLARGYEIWEKVMK